LEKVRKLATMRAARGLNFRIEIDGGIGLDTIGAAVRAGVEILVAGSAVFSYGDPAVNVEELLRAAHDATLVRA
jgi:ribulose-phosphate 3-epimerase